MREGHEADSTSWDEFLKVHAETLWQCDFFSKRIWTITGLGQCFVLTFLHVGSRKVFATKGSFKPDAAWMARAVDDFLSFAEGEDWRSAIFFTIETACSTTDSTTS